MHAPGILANIPTTQRSASEGMLTAEKKIRVSLKDIPKVANDPPGHLSPPTRGYTCPAHGMSAGTAGMQPEVIRGHCPLCMAGMHIYTIWFIYRSMEPMTVSFWMNLFQNDRFSFGTDVCEMEKEWWVDSRQGIGAGDGADMRALSVGTETLGALRERFVKIRDLG